MPSVRLSRTVAVPAAAALTAALLAGCGTATSRTAGGSGSAASPSVSTTASATGGATGTSPSATASGMGSGMGSGMAMASPGASGTTGTPAAGTHDAADVAFVTGMIPHHAQAVAMAELAATRADSAQVKALAVAIEAAQGPEITEMTGWLQGWGMPVPSGDASGMAMSGMAMSGMMSAADLARLATLSGPAFDRAWLAMMTSHHEGALAMARTELTAGTNPDAKALARSITTSQTAQITRMKALLAASG